MPAYFGRVLGHKDKAYSSQRHNSDITVNPKAYSSERELPITCVH